VRDDRRDENWTETVELTLLLSFLTLSFQGERDYANLPADLPAWKGNLNSVGHGGTYGELNGGLYGTAAANWMLWLFNGDAEAGAYFAAEGAAVADGWSDAVSQNIEGFDVPVGGGGAAAAAADEAEAEAAVESGDAVDGGDVAAPAQGQGEASVVGWTFA